MQLSTEQVIIILEIIAFAFLIIVLYQLSFAALSLRKVLKRAEKVTEQVEQVVLKPISMADATVDWMAHLLEGAKKKDKKEKGGKGSKK